jgi:hypothetical protein
MNETVLEMDIEFAFNSLQKAVSNERSAAVTLSHTLSLLSPSSAVPGTISED